MVTGYLGYKLMEEKLQRKKEDGYTKWLKVNETADLAVEKFSYNPLISVIVPVYNVKREQLEACIQSVFEQNYTNWQLCLVDDASTMPEVAAVLQQYEKQEKVTIVYRKENGHISRATNDGLQQAKGEYFGLLDCDDILATHALYEMVKKLNEDKTLDFIYSNEDFLTDDGLKRYSPVFKSEWAPDTFMSVMYTNHFSIFRKHIAEEIGGYRVGYEGSQDYDFVLRFTEKTKKIGYINKILYHWRAREESVASNPESKMYAYQAAIKAKEDALKRRNIKGRVEYMEKLYQSRVIYENEKEPLVSIIIPSKDNYACIQTCIESVRQKTDYKNYEVIVVDNGSQEENKRQYELLCQQQNCQYHYLPMEFNFSKMCNIGAGLAKGAFLLFLNDDTEVIAQEWLSRMVGQASLAHVGAVGAKLYYPNSQCIQHAGVVNAKVGPSHYYAKVEDRADVYLLQMDCNYSAVTGACVLIETKKFLEIGQFDENFPISYNDIDLCFSLVEKGYYNVLRSDAVLYHYESISRGIDTYDAKKVKRLEAEKKRLYAKHPYFNGYDPFYSEYFDNLSQFDNIYELKEIQPKQWKQEQLESYQEEDTQNVVYHLALHTYEKLKKVKVGGWFFFLNKKVNNLNQIRLALVNQAGQGYVFKVEKNYGDHFAEGENYKENLKLSGFKGVFDVSIVESGEYEVYMIIDRGISHKKYYIKTGEKVILSF